MEWWQVLIALAVVAKVLIILRFTVLRPWLKALSTTEVKLLRELLAQFKPNGGNSMRDLLDELERAIARLERQGVTAEAQGHTTVAGIGRIEAAAAVVATDLSDSHDRADAVDGEPGAAADAASQRN